MSFFFIPPANVGNCNAEFTSAHTAAAAKNQSDIPSLIPLYSKSLYNHMAISPMFNDK